MTSMELIQYEAGTGRFLKLDHEEFLIDPLTREMVEGADRFKTSVKRLFDRNKISTRSITSLVLPSFFTRDYEIPEGLEGEDLAPIITSEAERLYVFKRVDPIVGYIRLKDRKVLYTAYPKPSIDTFQDAFAQLKIPLISIDCNYMATLRGLLSMGVVQEEVANQVKWVLMIISDFTVYMALIEGSTVEKVMEIPLATQNADEDVLMNQIKEDFIQFSEYEVINKLVIINNSLKFLSTLLVENIGFQNTDVFDQNERTLTSRGAQDAPFPCSLEAIGGSLVRVFPQAPPLEMTTADGYQASIDEEKRQHILYGLMGVAALIFVLQLGLGYFIEVFTKSAEKTAKKIDYEIPQTQSKFPVRSVLEQKYFVQQGIHQNYRVVNLVIKIAEALPSDAWLRAILIESNEDLSTVDLTLAGSSLSSGENLEGYVQELNTELQGQVITPNIFPRQEEGRRFFEFDLRATKPQQ